MTCSGEMPGLVAAAAAGDSRAWDRLVAGFGPILRSIARRYRLSDADQDEVAQRTWLALVENIRHLREPAALGGWLATTARRESIRVLRQAARERPDAGLDARNAVAEDDIDIQAEEVEREKRRVAVRAAIRRAPEGHRPLLTALTSEPTRSYQEVSTELAMPIGSIGPTRARCLARLRRDPAVANLMPEFAPPGRPTRRPLPEIDL